MYGEKTKTRIIELMEKVDQPVTIGWVAVNLGVAWATARSLLQDMANSNKVKVVQTTRAAVFAL